MTRANTGHQEEIHGERRVPWPAHAAALLLLALVAVLRFDLLLSSAPNRTDERIYLQAFADSAAGLSPYRHAADGLDFYYPPAFAALGADAIALTSVHTVVFALRCANLAGLVCCVWLSSLFAPMAHGWCLAAAVAYVALAPPALAHGFASGNLSFAAVGSTLVALAAWRGSPRLSGLSLGLSAIVKPLAPIGIVALGLHRPRLGGKRQLLAAAIALMLAMILTLASPFLLDYLAVDGHLNSFPLRRSVSLYRWLHLAGVPATPLATLALVAAAVAWRARRGTLDPRQLLVLSMVGMALAAPALWSHTLLITLPLQVMALGRWWRGRTAVERPRSVLAPFELGLVALALAALQFVDGIGGGVEVSPVPIQLLVLAVPLSAPLALGAYVWRSQRDTVPVSSAAGASPSRIGSC